MIAWWNKKRCGPIGVDIGSRSVKLVQLEHDQSDVHEAARWELPPEEGQLPEARDEAVVAALVQARQHRNFRGHDAVFCVRGRDLFVQNIRVPQASGDDLEKIMRIEAASRLPYPADQADIRYIEAADIRQGETVRREVILVACRHAVVERTIALAERAKLNPLAIDVEPAAVLRSFVRQRRRSDDSQSRAMLVHVGAAASLILIARGDEILFIKYLDVCGKKLDQAVASRLEIGEAEAASLRRHNGERRADQIDPEISRSLLESCRPVLEQLAVELSLSMRYYSVTFRDHPLSQIVIGGGEAQPHVVEWLSERLGLTCEMADPLRPFDRAPSGPRSAQWDIASGLALRPCL